jgi:hypothetical protein
MANKSDSLKEGEMLDMFMILNAVQHEQYSQMLNDIQDVV